MLNLSRTNYKELRNSQFSYQDGKIEQEKCCRIYQRQKRSKYNGYVLCYYSKMEGIRMRVIRRSCATEGQKEMREHAVSEFMSNHHESIDGGWQKIEHCGGL